MTRIFNDPADFRDDAIAGFAAAYRRYVERIPGTTGFVRADGPSADRVSLVVGGGSGHYPSYGGIVGSGFATGCVLGDVFASPSTEQIYRVARAVDAGRGLILAFGNYAGDRLNFGAARERLVADGIDARIVYVTDDIASAPAAEPDMRRGIAGTFMVYKAGGASAERGDDLGTVERLMRKTNDATFSFGVAFAGCTLPGRDEALFEVAPGRMEFGLGIHGEAGVSTHAWMPSARLAHELVEAVLAERPSGTDGRAAIVLNGLGATKYEELFVLFNDVAESLGRQGVQLMEPEVGELVTSLDMAGCSLSVTWLDDELTELWSAPCETVSFKRGVVTVVTDRPRVVHADSAGVPVIEAGTVDAVAAAAADVVRDVIDAMHVVLVANEHDLGRLDSVAGDGDHGSGMVRGFGAAQVAAASATGSPGHVLDSAGSALAERAGGTSGMLWGVMLQAAGRSLDSGPVLDAGAVADAVRASLTAVQAAGNAKPGDKTLVDALIPFADVLHTRVGAGDALVTAWRSAAKAAEEAAARTAEMRPRLGRARPLAERSLGSPDPGAVSLALVVAAAVEPLTRCTVLEQDPK